MAGELVNMTELMENLSPVILDKLSPLITIFKAIGIALFIYIIFLIIRALFSWRSASKTTKIAKDVEQINGKMNVLIEKLDKLIEKKSKEEHKENKGIFRKLLGFKKEKSEKTEKLEKAKKKAIKK